jgi:hypothetical protein
MNTEELIDDTKHVLGGFLDSLAFADYARAFTREFPNLRCERGEDNLVRYWAFECGKRVSKAEAMRVEYWHFGYRAALRNWRPADYV